MKKIIVDGERAFLKKLAKLPDGVWRDLSYDECCAPGDRCVHRVMLTLRKEGRKHVFENQGTDPQAPETRPRWRRRPGGARRCLPVLRLRPW